MVLAFSILFALAYVFIVCTPPPVPVPDLTSVRGTYTWTAQQTGGGAASGAGTFGAVAGGGAGGTLRGSASAAAASVDSAYDATTRTQTTAASAWAAAGARVTTNTGAWPPLWRVATPTPLEYQGLSAVVRSAVEDGDHTVGIKPLSQDGRKVWRAAMTLEGTTVELVVDQLSGLVVWYADPRATFTAAVAWDAPAQGGSYSIAVPAGATTTGRSERTYTYRASLAASGAAAGFAPLSSDLAPDGYALAAAATRDAAGAPDAWLAAGQTGAATGAPAGQLGVAALYTRGLTWFSVEQVGPRSVPALRSLLDHDTQAVAATGLSVQRTTLQYGEFAGRVASTWYQRSGPSLFVSDERYAVFMTGALTRQELLSCAEGLKAEGGGRSPSPAASPSP